MEHRSRFSGVFRHTDTGFGWVQIQYDRMHSPDPFKPEDAELDGLWFTGYCGYKRSNGARSPTSFGVWHKTPDDELLMVSASAALRVMPLAVFVDWLDERFEQLLPNLTPEVDEDEARHHLREWIDRAREIALVSFPETIVETVT